MDSAWQPTVSEAATEDFRVGEAVVTAIADAEDVAPWDLDPLAATIDPDALERLVASMTAAPDEPTPTIEFAYSGYEVTVTGRGGVSIAELDPGFR